MSASSYGAKTVPFKLKMIRSAFRLMGSISPNVTGFIALEMFCTPFKRNDTQFTDPIHAPNKPIEIPFNGGKLIGNEWGSGRTILLVHGWESNSGRFGKLIQPLVDANFRVVAVDAPAHGKSTGRQTNYLNYSHAIHTIIQHVGPVYGIVAHSLGAASTLVMLNRYDDVKVEKVALYGTPNHINDIFSMFAKMVSLPEQGLRAMERILIYRTGTKLDMFTAAEIAKVRTERAFIVHDEQDNVVPFEGGKAVADNWRNAEFIATQGLGHRGIVTDTQILERLLSFLRA